jgi:hypothetical protein
MRKVGATASGSVIIEMSPIQFEALQKAMIPDPLPERRPAQAGQSPVKTMALRSKLDHVRNCVLKLKPSNTHELIRSIKTVGPFTGGFAETEIKHLMTILEREGLFTICEKGRLTYKQSHPAGPAAVLH